jgi:uncharacterized membrane protein YdjX (TVP38/TMEM64 family)
VGLLLIVAILIGGHEIKHHINAIEAWITQLGPWGMLAFAGLFILATSFLLPDWPAVMRTRPTCTTW